VPRRNAAVALLVLLALAGCGADTENGGDGPDATTAVRATVAKFGVATRTHDWQTICDDLLSETLVSKIEDVGLPCETAVEKGLGDVKNPTLEITDVSIAGARALVSIHTTATGQAASDDALQLVRQNGAWRIASLAAPEGGGSTAAPGTTATGTAPTAPTPTVKTVTTPEPRTTTTATTKTTRTTTSTTTRRTETTRTAKGR
jgi:hypothetical protein